MRLDFVIPFIGLFANGGLPVLDRLAEDIPLGLGQSPDLLQVAEGEALERGDSAGGWRNRRHLVQQRLEILPVLRPVRRRGGLPAIEFRQQRRHFFVRKHGAVAGDFQNVAPVAHGFARQLLDLGFDVFAFQGPAREVDHLGHIDPAARIRQRVDLCGHDGAGAVDLLKRAADPAHELQALVDGLAAGPVGFVGSLPALEDPLGDLSDAVIAPGGDRLAEQRDRPVVAQQGVDLDARAQIHLGVGVVAGRPLRDAVAVGPGQVGGSGAARSQKAGCETGRGRQGQECFHESLCRLLISVTDGIAPFGLRW